MLAFETLEVAWRGRPRQLSLDYVSYESRLDGGLCGLGVPRPRHQRQPTGAVSIGHKSAVDHCSRNPNVRRNTCIDTTKAGLRDSDHTERQLLILDDSVDDIRIGMKAPHPECVAENDQGLRCFVILILQQAAKSGQIGR